MIKSLNWVGSDVIRPDCSVDPTDPSCSNPANVTATNQRIANLYNDTILCSECFMKLFYERLGSDFLPDSDYSDYLVDQFQDIQDVCSTAIGDVHYERILQLSSIYHNPCFGKHHSSKPEHNESCAINDGSHEHIVFSDFIFDRDTNTNSRHHGLKLRLFLLCGSQ